MDRINKAKLDPLPLYEKIEVILQREEKPVPEKEDEETDEDYRERLIVVGYAMANSNLAEGCSYPRQRCTPSIKGARILVVFLQTEVSYIELLL